MLDPAIIKARRLARQLLHSSGVRAPEHIDLEAIAHACGADIVVGKLDGSTARVFRAGNRARIRVSERIITLGARRFSIAHELGHLVCGHEIPTEADVAKFLARACARTRGKEVDLEREANAFAAELLMPKAYVKSRCQVSPVNLCKAHAIADAFQTSIVASARRLAELSNERCAAVYSERSAVKWTVPSATFRIAIPSGTKLDSASLAFRYFADGSLASDPQTITSDAWLPSTHASEIVEHAEVIPEWGGVLSMLWIPKRTITARRRASSP